MIYLYTSNGHARNSHMYMFTELLRALVNTQL